MYMWKKRINYASIDNHNKLPQGVKKIELLNIKIDFSNFNKIWSAPNICEYLNSLEGNYYVLKKISSMELTHEDLQDTTIPQLLIDNHQPLDKIFGIVLFPIFNTQSISYILDPLKNGYPVSLWYSENQNTTQDNFYEYVKDNKKTTYIIYTNLLNVPKNVEHFVLNAIKYIVMTKLNLL